MGDIVKGTVAKVSKYGGIKLEGTDRWINAFEEPVKDFVMKQKLDGKAVEIELEEGKYVSVTEVAAKAPVSAEDRTDVRITKLACLKAAAMLHQGNLQAKQVIEEADVMVSWALDPTVKR